jgi:hypothetical protein
MPSEEDLQRRLRIASEAYSSTKDRLDKITPSVKNLSGNEKKKAKESIRQMNSFLKTQKRIITSLSSQLDKQIGKG